MKRAALWVAVLLMAACGTPRMHARDIVCTWKGNNAPNTVDYVLERKLPNGTWTEVTVTRAETFTVANVSMGVWTFRVYARDPQTPTNRSAASAEASLTVAPGQPDTLAVTLTG